MDANQRSEMNNQTNNGGNEKWNENAKGKTAPDAPLDHTYPNGASQQQQGGQGVDQMATPQSGMGPGQFADDSSRWDLPGGSMQTQQSGGSGPQQGLTDSHQRQMEQHSGAWGELELPVGRRAAGSSTSLLHGGNAQSAQQMNPQDPRQPELQGGSLGHHHGAGQSMQSSQDQPSTGRTQDNPAGNAQDSTDRAGSQTGADDAQMHESNDTMGGLPRSPGNSGPRGDNPGWQPGGSMNQDPNGVHESNDAAGGYPKSPAGANKLAGDQKMDDDTGFSRG